MSSDSSTVDIERELQLWYLRTILRRTNWLHRIDALRPHDIREMNILWDLSEICHGYATQFVIWAYSIRSIISITNDNDYKQKLESIVKLILKLIEMFWSDGYCFFFIIYD